VKGGIVHLTCHDENGAEAPNRLALTAEEVAGIILDALRREPDAVVSGDPVRSQKTIIDGKFYTVRVGQAVLNEMNRRLGR